MPVWIYFSFLMAPADVWGILDFLSAFIAQLAPLGWVLAVGDICVVYLYFDLRTLLTLDGDCSHPSHTQSSLHPTVSGLLLLLFLLLPLTPAPWEGFNFIFRETLNISFSFLGIFPQISGISGTQAWAYLPFSMCMLKVQRCNFQSSLSHSNIDNEWIICAFLCSGVNHLFWHWQPKTVLLSDLIDITECKTNIQNVSVCYRWHLMHIIRWNKGQEEQVLCDELALSRPSQMPNGFCWEAEISLRIFEIFWFSLQVHCLMILRIENILVLYFYFTGKSLSNICFRCWLL